MNKIFVIPLVILGSVTAKAEFRDNLADNVQVYHDSAKDAPELLTKIENMLKRGDDPNQKDSEDGSFMIFKALNPDHMKALELLVRYKANVDVRDKDGYTPFMRATVSAAATHPRDLSVVKFLLAHGADVNAKGDHNMTALHLAAANLKPQDGTELIELLLKSGANVNVLMGPKNQSVVAFSPMTGAAKRGNNQVIRLLAAAKADPNLKGPKGLSPFAAARIGGHPETVKLIESLGGHE